MKIILSEEVARKYLAYAAATRLEFSGFGFCEVDPQTKDIHVYDFVLMDVGSEGYTEIDPKRILPLMDRPDRANMRVWCHKHPINNWSSRDLQTILKEPMGSTPEQVGWSVSIVLTPVGWIGRIDNYKNNIHKDLEVEPKIDELYEEIREIEHLRRPFHFGRYQQTAGKGVLEAGAGEGDPEDEYWDDLYDEADELDEEYERAERQLDAQIETLEELACYPTDPTQITLAEVLEAFGIDWQEIRQER